MRTKLLLGLLVVAFVVGRHGDSMWATAKSEGVKFRYHVGAAVNRVVP